MKRCTEKTYENFDGGINEMWLGMRGILCKQAGETDEGIATLRHKTMKWLAVRGGKRSTSRAQRKTNDANNEQVILPWGRGVLWVASGKEFHVMSSLKEATTVRTIVCR